MANKYNKIRIEIAYGSSTCQRVYDLWVEAGGSIHTAIDSSPLCKDFPEIDLTQCKVGVFSKRRTLDDIVYEGDRIEVYRPLLVDPKEARRRKAN